MKKALKIIRLSTIVVIILGLLGGLFYTFAISPNQYQITNHEYVNEKIDSQLNGLKILYLSDINLSNEKSISRFEDIVKDIANQSFDIAIFGGDLYDEKIIDSEKVSSLFKQIKCSYGKFAILGEKDSTSTLEVTQILNNGGFEVLSNEKRTIYYQDSSFDLIACQQDTDLKKLKINNKRFSLCISHQPDTFKKNIGTIDLQLSGHSLGGGIYIPYIGSLFKQDGAKTYNHGIYKEKGSTLLVSNGLYDPSFPFKVFAPNEVNILTFKSSNSKS